MIIQEASEAEREKIIAILKKKYGTKQQNEKDKKEMYMLGYDDAILGRGKHSNNKEYNKGYEQGQSIKARQTKITFQSTIKQNDT